MEEISFRRAFSNTPVFRIETLIPVWYYSYHLKYPQRCLLSAFANRALTLFTAPPAYQLPNIWKSWLPPMLLRLP